MALELKITPSQFEKLPELLQSEYVLDGDSYKLEVKGLEDIGALKRAKDHEKARRKETEERQKELQAEIDALKNAKDIKSGDTESLHKSWEEKFNTKIAELEREKEELKESLSGRSSKLEGKLKNILVDSVAKSIAEDISTVPVLMKPHIMSRLGVIETEDGDFKTSVLDASGQPSASTLDELKEEFLKNPEYKSVIIGSKASGGAKDDNQITPSSDRGSSGDGNNRFSSLNDEELLLRIQDKIKSKEE